MIKLGVNVDHVATLRQARGTDYPCPVKAAQAIAKAGAHNITCHLREDRRHIQDEDVYKLSQMSLPLNFEMAARDEMFQIAYDIKPETVTLVPEKREELTTEHGLNVKALSDTAISWVEKLLKSGCKVSMFIDANTESIDACLSLGVCEVEIHTGFYADAANQESIEKEKNKIKQAVEYAHERKVEVHLGHGLTQDNLKAFKNLPINSMQIGHALIADSIYLGLGQATKNYLACLS